MRYALTVTMTMALLLGACAAAVPGYVPPSARRDKFLAAAPKGGGLDAGGVYHLSEQEKNLDCKQLNGSITIKILQMRDAVNRQRPSTVAATAQNLSRPLKGTTRYGVDLGRDYAEDQARLEALNRQLAAKGCRTYDITAQLKPGNTEPPRPMPAEATKPAKP